MEVEVEQAQTALEKVKFECIRHPGGAFEPGSRRALEMKRELDSGLKHAGMTALRSPELCSEFLTQDTSAAAYRDRGGKEHARGRRCRTSPEHRRVTPCPDRRKFDSDYPHEYSRRLGRLLFAQGPALDDGDWLRRRQEL